MRNCTTRSSALLVIAALLAAPVAHADGALARDVLTLDQRIGALERSVSQQPRLAVYVGARTPEHRLRRVSLKLDQQPMLHYEFSLPEWEALADGGLHAALGQSLAPGEHRLQVEIVARDLDPVPGAARVIERLDQRFTVTAGLTTIELNLVAERFGRKRIEWHDWQIPRLAAEERVRAPALRGAEFSLASGRPVAAAQTLLRSQLDELGIAGGSELLAAAFAQASADAHHSAPGSALETYNAAVAGLEAGAAPSVTALAALGTGKPEDEAGLALRDRANLVLGYHHLRQGDSKSALEVLARVRSPGPHGNAALLAFGWAFLVSPEIKPEVGALMAQPAFLAGLSSSMARNGPDRTARLHQALVPWTELVGRDPLDPAAQEGALALAWALDELGTGKQAHLYYQRAATQLELARLELDHAQKQVQSGTAAQIFATGMRDARNGWRGWLADLPAQAETAYLQYLLSDPSFLATLDPYRATQALQALVDDSSQRLAALAALGTDTRLLSAELDALRPRLAQRVAITRQGMESAALHWIGAQRHRTERYLVQARFALARHFDRIPEIDLSERKPVAARSAS